MAERIVSPGVFTSETDSSFLPGAISAIGAAIVGPTVKGPALVPTQIRTFSEFRNKFGSYTDESYLPFTVEEYLRSGQVITVTRLLYEDGYALTNGALAVVASSGSGATQVKHITHLLHPTVAVLGSGSAVAGNCFQTSVINNYQSGSFEIKVSGSFTIQAINGNIPSFLAGNGTSISASIVPTDSNYISTIFGKNPKSLDYPVYVQYENKIPTGTFNNMGNVTVSLEKISNYEFLQDYAVASTPWITSQKIGSTAKNLFKFHTLSHGTSVNYEIKAAISNIKTSTEVADPEGYGSFTVTLRRVNQNNIPNSPYTSQDTDSQPDVVEQSFANVNLNPNSSRYIERVIGNRYQTVNAANELVTNGDYPNLSQYVRVEVDSAVSSGTNSNTLIPFGFRAVTSPTPMVSGSINLVPTTYKTDQTISGIYNNSVSYGYDFTVLTNLSYLAPTPTSGSTTGSNADFYLGNISQNTNANFPVGAPYTGTLEAALTGGTFTTNVLIDTRKFIVPFQGGFDGARPNLPKFTGANLTSANTFGFDCSTSAATGTVAYRKAFALLSNADQYDINMLLTPGIIDSLHSAVSSEARNLCANTRFDTFYVMDSNKLTDSIATVVNQVTTIDNNYTATYWPWVRIVNPSNNVPVWVPPSVVIPGALTFNDSVAAPWYAPAGLTRGGLATVTSTYQNLSQANRDTLYEARVNPIANFPNDGVCIWGQKTLQALPSALDRVNVRRLLITVKKFIASASRYLVFDPNDQVIRDKFLSIVNPYLEQVRAQRGLTAFRVVMDNTNNTPQTIDQNILYGKLFLQPTRTAEFIILDFNIQPTGAAFPE
jgi:hypothetical protein